MSAVNGLESVFIFDLEKFNIDRIVWALHCISLLNQTIAVPELNFVEIWCIKNKSD